MTESGIVLKGVKTHNLKDLTLTVPHNKITVITGVSGSGKSSLAFDTLYAEGQRRYVESLSAYARQFLERMEKPDIESVSGILPAISIQAQNVINNARSTVGTQTEINDYLRILFARIGRTFCEQCGRAVEVDTPAKVADHLIRNYSGQEVMIVFALSFDKKARKYGTEFLEEMVKQGFSRILIDGQVADLSADKALLKKISAEAEVLVDRLEIDSAAKGRLIDSVEMAYRYGKGKARVHAGKKTEKYSAHFHCAHCDKEFKLPTPNTFSFNSPLGACPECQGFGRVITVDKDLVIPDRSKSLQEGAIDPWTKPSYEWFLRQLKPFCAAQKISMKEPYSKLSAHHKDLIWNGDPDSEYESVSRFFEYLEKKTYKMHVRVFLSRYRAYVDCAVCQCKRLKPEALRVKVDGKNITELQSKMIDELHDFFVKLPLTPHEKELCGPVYAELLKRLSLLKEVGLDYLTLDRLSRTLSGGEAQRINLTTSLSASLVDTLYVLDEPSIGLHERDNALLIRILQKLRDLGNTVVVIEHDRQMIRTADEVIDMGPLAGDNGGQIVFQGSFEKLLRADTLSGKYLSGKERVTTEHPVFVEDNKKWLKVKGASQHNLKNIDVQIPLESLVVVTGVSGSGKSTLLYEILHKHFLRSKGQPVQDPGRVQTIQGWRQVDEIILVDQSPIGRTPRSNPITYLKAFDEIRKLFARTDAARRGGMEAGDFSFNVEGGRCPECEGNGQIKVEMHFLADLYVRCDKCQGKRYQKHILEIRYNEKNIDDILNMTFDEAFTFFAASRELIRKISIVREIGLGYLRLGQSALTLSQGEAQRMKLAAEMLTAAREKVLYLFDEPTTGLHYYDIHFLMKSFSELLKKGHSLIVIEHNMEVIRNADYLIDLGPEGGNRGGEMVFSGTPRQMLSASLPRSYTAKCLREYLQSYPEDVKPRGLTKVQGKTNL